MERDIQVKDGIVTKAAERAGRVRNFVPEGEETPAELVAAARRHAQRSQSRQGFRPNFIPGSDDEPIARLSPEANRERNEREANESAMRRQSASKERRWEEACAQVLKMTEGQATQYIGAMPSAVRELFLLAEEATQARPSVLKTLGKVSEKSRVVWGRELSDGQRDVQEIGHGSVSSLESVFPDKNASNQSGGSFEPTAPEERPVAIMANEPDPPFSDDELSDAFAQLVPETDEPEAEEAQPEE